MTSSPTEILNAWRKGRTPSTPNFRGADDGLDRCVEPENESVTTPLCEVAVVRQRLARLRPIAKGGLEAQRWMATLFVDNLLNRHYPAEYINLLSFTGPPYNRIVTNQPRTVGVSVALKFH